MDPPVSARFDPDIGKGRLVLTRRYAAAPAKVWAALATPERIAEWMGVDWSGDAALGFGASFSYRFRNSDMESIGEVIAFDPPRLLEHTWFANLGRPAVVRWEVTPDGDGSLLTLSQTVSFPDDGPRNAAGWTMLMTALAQALGEAPEPPGSWKAVRDRYAASFPPEAIRDGWMEQAGDRPLVRFERQLRHAPAAVWAALTTPERLEQWIGAVEIEPHVGGRFDLDFLQGSFMHGTITAIEPLRLLEMLWREPWFADDDVRLRFELSSDADGGTRLVLIHTFPPGYEPFDYLAGWHQFMDTLEAALDGTPIAWRSEVEKAQYAIREGVYRAVAGASTAA